MIDVVRLHAVFSWMIHVFSPRYAPVGWDMLHIRLFVLVVFSDYVLFLVHSWHTVFSMTWSDWMISPMLGK